MAYTAEEQALGLAVLVAEEGNPYEAEKAIGIPARTLKRWNNGEYVRLDGISAEVKKRELAEKFESIALRILNSISEEDILSAPLLPRMTTAGIAIDKMRLLREESTSINEHTSRNVLSVEEKRARILEILTGGRDTGDVQLPVSAGDSEVAIPGVSANGDAAGMDA
jgi:hypothetical protein